MEKEIQELTAEEFFRSKINEYLKPHFALSRIEVNAEKAMRWAHEFMTIRLTKAQSEADREIERLKERYKLLQHQLENQEHYNELLVSELNTLKGLTCS